MSDETENPTMPDAPLHWDTKTCANGKPLRRCHGCNNFNSCAKRNGCMKAVKGGRMKPTGSYP